MSVGVEGFELVVAAVMGWDGTELAMCGLVFPGYWGLNVLYRCRCRARRSESVMGWYLLEVCA